MSNIDKSATDLLIENGELVADTLRHLADNDVLDAVEAESRVHEEVSDWGQ